jgi:heme oxygenase
MHAKTRRLALREASHDIHERLDATVGEWADLAAYRVYLSAMAAFRIGVESALSRLDWPETWPYRPAPLGPDLRSDLADLGLTLPLVTEPSLTLPGPSGLLGALYVLEGSAFGARILRRRAAELGLDDGFGARHLGRMAGEGGSWRAFLGVLEAEPAYDPEEAGAGAEATFRAALRCFEGTTRVAA